MESSSKNLGYVYQAAIDGLLGLVISHATQARVSISDDEVGDNLVAASKALQRALEIYGSHIGVLPTEEEKVT